MEWQYPQTPETKERARSLGGNVQDYDGCAQLYMRTWDDWLALQHSEEYSTALAADCRRFMQFPQTFMVGEEILIADDASRQIGGNDGLDIITK